MCSTSWLSSPLIDACSGSCDSASHLHATLSHGIEWSTWELTKWEPSIEVWYLTVVEHTHNFPTFFGSTMMGAAHSLYTTFSKISCDSRRSIFVPTASYNANGNGLGCENLGIASAFIDKPANIFSTVPNSSLTTSLYLPDIDSQHLSCRFPSWLLWDAHSLILLGMAGMNFFHPMSLSDTAGLPASTLK